MRRHQTGEGHAANRNRNRRRFEQQKGVRHYFELAETRSTVDGVPQSRRDTKGSVSVGGTDREDYERLRREGWVA